MSVAAAPPLPGFPDQPPASNQCQVVEQNPLDYTVMAPDTVFTPVWVLENTGDTTWNEEDYDMRYLASSGGPLHLGPDVNDLVIPTEPGWTYGLTMTMITPYTPGTYREAWSIVHGNQTICVYWLIIEVR